MSAVFENLESFCFVHHRGLNTPQTLDEKQKLAAEHPAWSHAIEGDVCWDFEDGREDLYFFHPNRLTDTLSRQDIDRKKEDGTLLTVDGLIEAADDSTRYVLELKVGRGSPEKAIGALVGKLQSGLAERYWLDGFSIRLLDLAKRADPAAPTSLHTRMVLGPCVLRTAPEFFPVSWRRIHSLDTIDALTLTYKYSHASWLSWAGATIDSVSRHVPPKVLIMGGCATPKAFRTAAESRALGGYAKFPISELS